jgi:succinate dehydrogenase / fumarate reductase cytochrome b subunit
VSPVLGEVAAVPKGWVTSFYGSTIGKKIVMAATGVVLIGFVTGHVLGNLLVFRGPAALNRYSELLKSSAVILWAVRTTLLGAVVLHVHSALSLTRLARAARPTRYDKHATQASTFSTRTLRVGGVVLLAFIVFHLLHLTTGTVHPAFSPTDVYGNVLVAFSIPAVTVFYLVAMLALGLHLHHGIWSAFQTLGLNHPHLERFRRGLATVLAVGVSLGFSIIVLAVAFQMIG